MNDSVFDLIDHAIREHDLSTDAMRWTPDPETTTPGAPAVGTYLLTVTFDDGYQRTTQWNALFAGTWTPAWPGDTPGQLVPGEGNVAEEPA